MTKAQLTLLLKNLGIRIPRNAFKLALVISDLDASDTGCFAKKATLAKKLHVSFKTIQRAIIRLRSLGLVTDLGRAPGRHWRIKTLGGPNRCHPLPDQPATPFCPPNLSTDYNKITDNQKIYKKKKNKKEKLTFSFCASSQKFPQKHTPIFAKNVDDSTQQLSNCSQLNAMRACLSECLPAISYNKYYSDYTRNPATERKRNHIFKAFIRVFGWRYYRQAKHRTTAFKHFKRITANGTKNLQKLAEAWKVYLLTRTIQNARTTSITSFLCPKRHFLQTDWLAEFSKAFKKAITLPFKWLDLLRIGYLEGSRSDWFRRIEGLLFLGEHPTAMDQPIYSAIKDGYALRFMFHDEDVKESYFYVTKRTDFTNSPIDQIQLKCSDELAENIQFNGCAFI